MKDKNNKKKDKKPLFAWPFPNIRKLLILAIGICIINRWADYYVPAEGMQYRDDIELVAYTQFRDQLEDNQVHTVYMNNGLDKMYYSLVEDENFVYQTNNPDYDTFKSELLDHSVVILPYNELQTATEIEHSRGAAAILVYVVFIGAMFISLTVDWFKNATVSDTPIIKKKKKVVAGVSDAAGNSSKEISDNDEKKKTFDDIAGLDEVKRDMKCLVDFLVNKDKYTAAGAKLPKGVILYGPPGTGKTLLAKAIAGEADVPFLFASGSDFIETYVGVGAKRVRELFATARKQAPCIIFIDEIDAIGGKRHDGDNGEDRKTINAILTEMDGFTEAENILVIAATNRLEDLDDALTRPGRFTDQFCVPLPETTSERVAIINMYAKNKKLSDDINIRAMAKEMIGFSPAKIEAVLNEAAIISVQEGTGIITKQIVDKAMYKMMLHGHMKENTERSQEELELVAWHEAGHALIGHMYGKEITKVTIISSTSGAGGVTFSTPKKTSLHSVEDIKHEIMELYAGRVGELLFYNENKNKVTTGAANDIERATNLIHQFVASFGMSDTFGMLKLDGSVIDKAQIMQIEIDMAKELEQTTIQTLKEHRNELEEIANVLMKKETIYKQDIELIMDN